MKEYAPAIATIIGYVIAPTVLIIGLYVMYCDIREYLDDQEFDTDFLDKFKDEND